MVQVNDEELLSAEEEKTFSVNGIGVSFAQSADSQLRHTLNCKGQETPHPDTRTPSAPTTALICEKKALD